MVSVGGQTARLCVGSVVRQTACVHVGLCPCVHHMQWSFVSVSVCCPQDTVDTVDTEDTSVTVTTAPVLQVHT